MKSLSILAAFLGGAVVGAAAGVLFAPERGEDTRNKIVDALRKRGIKLSRTEMEDLVDEIAAEVKVYTYIICLWILHFTSLPIDTQPSYTHKWQYLM